MLDRGESIPALDYSGHLPKNQGTTLYQRVVCQRDSWILFFSRLVIFEDVGDIFLESRVMLCHSFTELFGS